MRAVILDDVMPANLVEAANAQWPRDTWPGWHAYSDERGGKRASDLREPLPHWCGLLLGRLAALPVADLFPDLPPLLPDLSLYGAGLHSMPAGPGLGEHVDADTHARMGIARVLSAVLWVHDQWLPEWGGALVFSSGLRVTPMPGRLVVFDCRGEWHQVEAVTCPPDVTRRSVAIFWYAAEAGPGRRTRAMFAEAEK